MEGGLEAVFAKAIDAVGVFGGGTLAQSEDADQFIPPSGETAGEFEFKDHAAVEDTDGVVHFGEQAGGGIGFEEDIAVEGDADGIIVGAHPGFALVGDVGDRPGLEVEHEGDKPLDGGEVTGVRGSEFGGGG